MPAALARKQDPGLPRATCPGPLVPLGVLLLTALMPGSSDDSSLKGGEGTEAPGETGIQLTLPSFPQVLRVWSVPSQTWALSTLLTVASREEQ